MLLQVYEDNIHGVTVTSQVLSGKEDRSKLYTSATEYHEDEDADLIG